MIWVNSGVVVNLARPLPLGCDGALSGCFSGSGASRCKQKEIVYSDLTVIPEHAFTA